MRRRSRPSSTAWRSSLAEAGISPGDLGVVIHGTTLATNALIERRGARTAFVTTRRFSRRHRDAHRKPLRAVRPEPARCRRRWCRASDRFTVQGRIGAHGQELQPLDEAALAALAAQHPRQAASSAVAIGFMHMPTSTPRMSGAAREILQGRPDLPISICSEVSPQMREFERFNTVCANAYVRPRMADYLERLQVAAAEMGAAARSS